MKTGKPIKNIVGYIPGSRKKKWALVSKFPIKDSFDKVIGLIGTFVDMTEEKRAEELHELLELSIRNMSDGFTIYNVEKDEYVYLNNAVEKIFGNTFDYLNGKGREFLVKNYIHPDDREIQMHYFKTKQWPDVNEYRIIRSDGEIRLIRTKTFHDILYKGVKCNVNIDTDITDLSEKHFTKLIEFILEGLYEEAFILMDEKTRKIIYANKAVERLFGYSKDKVASVDFWLNNCVHPDDREKQLELIRSGNIPKNRHYRIITPDGKLKYIESVRIKNNFQGQDYLTFINREVAKMNC